MSDSGELERFRAKGTYDAAALDYAEASQRFWGFLSTRTVDRLRLPPGARVLDVASGPGVSTIAAAQRVGAEGSVVALDSARQMLEMVRDRAEARGLDNVRVAQGDMARLDFEPRSFDAVISVLGIFFVPDMQALVANLHRLLKPNGQLAVTTFGAEVFAPAIGLWKEAVREVRPDAPLRFPWQRTDQVEAVRALFESAGVEGAEIQVESGSVELPGPDDWWLAVRGSGLRRTLLDLDEAAVRTVREACDGKLAREGVDSMEIPGIYVVAEAP